MMQPSNAEQQRRATTPSNAEQRRATPSNAEQRRATREVGSIREGSLEAPRREPIDWQSADFHDRDAVDAELARVFDVCHGCRRCVNLCEAFPTLFDLIDESHTMEVDGVDRDDYGKVVEQCFLCDLCAETKCPYLPPPTSGASTFPTSCCAPRPPASRSSGRVGATA